MATELESSRACAVSVTRAGNAVIEKLAKHFTLDCYTLEKYACDGFEKITNLDSFFKNAFLEYDTIITVMAAGIVVRAVAPNLVSKTSDPGVIVVDVSGNYYIPILSGHLGRANANAKILAAATGGTAIMTTASDVLERPAVDTIAAEIGAHIANMRDAKEVTALIVDGKNVGIIGAEIEGFDTLPYPADLFDRDTFYSNLEAILPRLWENYDGLILVSDLVRLVDTGMPTVQLIPETTTIGIGTKKGISRDAVLSQIYTLLGENNISPSSLKELATIELKSEEPGILAAAEDIGIPVTIVDDSDVREASRLFSGSDFVEEQTGFTSVSEPCGFVASNEGTCIGPPLRENGVVVSAWREEIAPKIPGKITVTGIGPGSSEMMTAQARESLKTDVLVGYKTYIDLVKNMPEVWDTELLASGMRDEVSRCETVLDLAESGKDVTLISSGDSGVYGMAGLLLERADMRETDFDIEVVPGVSAANAAASLLGAPLMNDYCVISLSDQLTPWETIEKRLRAAAEGDFVIALYNPKSMSRPDNIVRAQEILLEYRSPETPVGIVTNAGRYGESSVITNLEFMCENPIDMFSTVIVGSSQTIISEDGTKMITPRGYKE